MDKFRFIMILLVKLPLSFWIYVVLGILCMFAIGDIGYDVESD